MSANVRGWPRMPLTTLVLAIVVATLAGCLMAVLARGTHSHVLLATAGLAPERLSIDSDAPEVPIDIASIQLKPLLHATRSFYQAPLPLVAAAPPKPDYRLRGTLIIPSKAPIAIVARTQTSESRKVKVGEDLEGWRVASIDRNRVVLAWGEERTEISAGPPNLLAAATTPTVAGARPGLKRVSLKPQQVAAVGVQTLGARGSAPTTAGGRTRNDPPRLYRPPPQ